MKSFQHLLLVAGLMACLIPATASATTIEAGGAPQNQAVAFEMSLASGTTMIIKDKNGTTNQTCTGSTLSGKTGSPFTGTSVSGTASTWTFTGCSHTMGTIVPGKLSFTWTSGTSGTVSSSEAELTIKSTTFGISAICKTGTGSKLGTLTGTKEGNATIDAALELSCGALGATTWAGTYTVTSPQGLGITS